MGVKVFQKVRGRGKPWWIIVRTNGTARTKKIGDRQAAEAVASELRRRLKTGELSLPTDEGKRIPTFGEYGRKYVECYAKTSLKYSTYRGYETILRIHLLPELANKRLDQITRADIKAFLLRKQKDGMSTANIRVLISGIFTHAVDEGKISVNPAARLGKLTRKRDRCDKVCALSPDQVSQFLSTVKEHAPQYYALFMCAFRTGMRMGELLGLAWEDLDFEAKKITIRRACTGGRFSTPKSNKSRIIDMSEQLKTVLLEHREQLRKKHRGKLLIYEIKDMRGNPKVSLVFPCQNGRGPIDGNNLRRRVFMSMIKKAELPPLRFHDIRHTFASLLLAQGAPLHYVKEQMGHASIQTTVDIYGHFVEGIYFPAVDKLDDPISASVKEGAADAA